MAAVTNNGDALRYASEKLKKDEEIVLTAVSNYTDALKHAHEGLKKEK